MIYKTSFFGILKDAVLNPKFYLTAFLLKALAIGAFYILYTKLYGSILYSDTGNFYRDSKAIHDIAYFDLTGFIKLMFGLQDDGKGSYIFEHFLKSTTTWDKAPGEILYNDNRIILKLHALIHFISFGNYYVHALFSCFFSFLGINWIYTAFRDKFPGKEICFFMIWVLLPGVWFWTGALFKEGPALFLIGWLLISLKRVLVIKKYSLKNIIALIVIISLSFLFKPYLMLPLLLTSILFFSIITKTTNSQAWKYIALLFLCLAAANYSVRLIFKKDAIQILSERQRDFLDMSNGGLFLLNENKFIRAPYDYSLLKIDSSQAVVKAKIKAGATYSYCELSHQQDTLICTGNLDTTNIYTLLYFIPKANTTLHGPILDGTLISFIKSIPYAEYITLFKPLFWDARNIMDFMISIENGIIVISLLIFLFNGIKRGFYDPHYIYFLSIVFFVLLLIGITSPNLGAIQRYRSLVIPFLLLAALLGSSMKDSSKWSNFFKNTPQ